MDISFEPLTSRQAEEIASWRYEEPYHVYDYRDQPADDVIRYLSDPACCIYAVLREWELIGFRSFGADGTVPGGTYDEDYLDIGGGLRPDLTGQGLGEKILKSGIEFGAKKFGTNRFRVTVAEFNERALKVCKRVGFAEHSRFSRGDGVCFIILVLDSQVT